MRRALNRISDAARRRPGAFAAAAILVLLAAFLAMLELTRPHVSGDELRLDQFRTLYTQAPDRIRNAEFLDQDSYIVGTYERPDGTTARYRVAYLGEETPRGELVEQLAERRIPTEVNQQFFKSLREPFQYLLPSAMIVVVIVYMVVAMTQGTGLFGKRSGARRLETAERRATFADVAGVDEAIEELDEVRGYLSDPERFASMGARVPGGYLLVGPPGCGKTLLARAVAGETGAAFFSISAPNFNEMYVGVGAARVRELFREAGEAAPAIIFIDEIDAIGASRGAGLDGHREREQTLNQILTELDGFDERTGVIVMAATNRADILDPALVRPGRFDRTITISLPDRDARQRILAVHARGKPLAPDVDLQVVAGMTRGLSGADLANVLNEATLLAARRGEEQIIRAHVEEAVDRVSLGISRAHVLSDEERRIIAHHEAGHALVGLMLPGGSVPHKVTILGRGEMLGAVRWIADGQDRLLYSRSELLDRMATLLGGRVAEELVIGEPGSGAAEDLRHVSELARRMVRDWGMSDAVGALAYEEHGDGGGSYSEETARLIDAEVRRLVEEARARAASVLDEHRGLLDRLAATLIERETLSAEELKALASDERDLRTPSY